MTKLNCGSAHATFWWVSTLPNIFILHIISMEIVNTAICINDSGSSNLVVSEVNKAPYVRDTYALGTPFRHEIEIGLLFTYISLSL